MRNDAFPYFPIALENCEEGGWFVHPTTGRTHLVNAASVDLLKLCDGCHSWGAILEEAAGKYGLSVSRAAVRAAPVIGRLTKAGLVWWRSQSAESDVPPEPQSVFWNITGRCNLACLHCAVASGRKRRESFDTAECRRLIDEMRDLGVREIVFSGGEPLLRPDWLALAVHSLRRGMTVSLSTNGTLVTPKTARRIASVFSDVQVSLDGATPAVHDAFRGVKGAWRHAVQGIRYLVREGVPVTVGATVTTRNYDEIEALCDLALKMGSRAFRLIPFIPFGRGAANKALEVSPAKMKSLVGRLRPRRQTDGLFIAPLEFECLFEKPPLQPAQPTETMSCGGAVSYFTITEKGDVLPCHFFSGVEAENVTGRSLDWIWENSRFLRYFRSLRLDDLSGNCRRCDWLPNCRGSCRAANFVHGVLFDGNVHCWRP